MFSMIARPSVIRCPLASVWLSPTAYNFTISYKRLASSGGVVFGFLMYTAELNGGLDIPASYKS